MDDVLEARNVNGHLEANILFADQIPTVEEMKGFEKVLCFIKGKVIGETSNVHRMKVVLTEENHYSEVQLLGTMDGDYEVVGLETERVRYSLGEEGITVSKSPNLTTPGTYNTAFAFVGEDWAVLVVVQIVMTVPLRVRHNNVDRTNGQTVTINMTAPNYSPQYLSVFGSRDWEIVGVEPEKVSVSPLSGEGYDNTWNSTTLTLSKPAALVVSELITTTFRILAQTQWVDVVVNLHPPVTLHFADPREEEAGAPGGTEPVYVYL